MSLAITVISVLLIAFFLFASSIKLTGWQKQIFAIQLQFFHSYGLDRLMMFLVGAIELFGAVTIGFQDHPVGLFGALAIFLTSIGAIGFHLKFDTWKDGIPALITGLLSAFFIVQHPCVTALLNHE